MFATGGAVWQDVIAMSSASASQMVQDTQLRLDHRNNIVSFAHFYYITQQWN